MDVMGIFAEPIINVIKVFFYVHFDIIKYQNERGK
jgi:hypothetical protein